MERNVICIKWGDKFGADYVNRLYKMVEKNLTLEYRFVCFTDNSEGLLPQIEVRDLPEFRENKSIPDRGWRKLSLFNQTLADLRGTALFLDLDVVIKDDLAPFFEVTGDFLIVKDWDFPNSNIGNSSVFRFEIGKYPQVLENFYKLGSSICQLYRNEQAYLSDEMFKSGVLQYWNKSWCVSFKRNCLQPFPLNFFKLPKDPQGAKIIVFHGRPMPRQARNGFCGKAGFRYVKPTTWLDKYVEF